MPNYLVIDTETGFEHLVSAPRPESAISYVTAPRFAARIAEPEDYLRLGNAGVTKIAVAGEKGTERPAALLDGPQPQHGFYAADGSGKVNQEPGQALPHSTSNQEVD